MAKYGEVRHRRDKIERSFRPSQDYTGRRSINVKVEIERNKSTLGASGGFKALYTALACPVSAGKSMPQNWDHYHKTGSFPRGRRCGDGYGKSPTKAYQMALKELAKIKR